MSRVKLAHRLWLAAACPILALTFISYQYYQQTLRTGLTVSERQLSAMPLIYDLKTLLHHVEEQRAKISLAILGITTEPQAISDENAVTTQIVKKISAAMATFEGMRAKEAWVTTQNKLAPIQAKADLGELESFKTYTLATEAILVQIDTVGIEAGFETDVEGGVALNLVFADLLPHLIEEIRITRELAIFHTTIDQRTAADITKINGHLSLSKFRFLRIIEKLNGVGDYTPDFDRDISPLKVSLTRNFGSYAASIDRFLTGEKVEVQSLYDQGDAAKDDANALFERIFKEINGAVQKNIEAHQRDLMRVAAIGGAGVLVCGFILVLVVSSFVRSINKLISVTQQIAAGDRNLDLQEAPGDDEMRVLGRAVAHMYRAICATENAIREDSERKQLVSDITSQLQSEADVKVLGETYLRNLSTRLEIILGAIYLYEESSEDLSAVAVYASEGETDALPVVDGTRNLLGEAVRTGEMIIIDGLSDDNTFSAQSGLVRIKPETVVLAPILFESEVLGVIEIGFVKKIAAEKLDLFRQTLEAFAIRLKASLSRSALETLYDQTVEQASELEERQTELEASNQELEHKTQELEQQQVELEAINQTLDQQHHILEEKNASIEAGHIELQRAKAEIERKAADLEQGSRYKSEFLANMSHELRSPLNGILIFSEILAKNARGVLSEKEILFAKTIHSSGNDLLNLIEDILDLSKVEAGRLEVRSETFAADDFTNSMEVSFRAQAESKGLDLRIEVADDIPATWQTDRQRLGQIVRNFLSNALKFTDDGSVTLHIRKPKEIKADSGLDRETSVEIMVIDTGIGIKKEDQDRLFVAFRQIDSGANRKFAGTGLGLSISLKLATLLGGYVTIDSKPGEGSSFGLVVPINLLPSSTEGGVQYGPGENEVISYPTKPGVHGAAPSTLDDRQTISASDKTMLIIEDDIEFARFMMDRCRSKGYKCIVCYSGEEGLANAFNFQPHGIILDIKLPGIDGLSVLNRLKTDPRTHRIPVHVVSAYEYRMEVGKHENVGFLRKPISYADLDVVIGAIDMEPQKPIAKILLVTKDEKVGPEIGGLTASGNFTTTSVSSGADAIKAARSEKFQCVVADMGLPDMSAIELLKQIRAENEGGTLAFIIIAEKELTSAQEIEIRLHKCSVIIKGEKARERLLDEVSLFLHSVATNPHGDVADEASNLDTGNVELRNKKVLLVDDDMRNLFAMMSILETQGLIVQTATNGLEALACLEKQPNFDLVLMDMMMPEMDGYEATRAIRKMERHKKLPVIALTARAMKGEREQCLASGANDYLSKPLKIEQLMSLIKLWIK